VLTSVAVLSDVHGVLPVLEAVLAEPDVVEADLVVVVGDHASGPQPVEVLDRLIALGSSAVLIRGNADRELVSIARGEDIELPDEVSPWVAAQLTIRHVTFLDSLPLTATIPVDGFGPVLFCHATPRDDEEVVLVDSRLERWADVLRDVSADIDTIVCGHTHMPFVRLVDRRLVINPGSVGMPYGRAGGSWALLRRGSVTVHQTSVDVEATVARVIEESSYPDRQEWAEYYLRATASDAEALTTFASRDGRSPL
jgi:predicted phosphodiesterase